MERQWALITGASGGLGEAIAGDLAGRGYNLVLTARREDVLNSVAARLSQQHGCQVTVEPIDLSIAGSAAALVDRLSAHGLQPNVFVNNAAFGVSGPFIESDAVRLNEMLQLDIVSFTELTLLIGRQMASRGSGKILLVASVGAYSPTPLMAAYAAAKAYVLSLGEALHVELAPTIGVTVLSPGIMDTGFGAVSGLDIPDGMRRSVLSTDKVAQIGLDALFTGKSSIIAGRLNQLSTSIGGLFSRHVRAKLSYRIFQAATRHGNR
jgi:uncharacterized protein